MNTNKLTEQTFRDFFIVLTRLEANLKIEGAAEDKSNRAWFNKAVELIQLFMDNFTGEFDKEFTNRINSILAETKSRMEGGQ